MIDFQATENRVYPNNDCDLIFTSSSPHQSMPPACNRPSAVPSPSSLPPSPENHTDLSPPSLLSSSPIILAPKLQEAESGNPWVTSGKQEASFRSSLSLLFSKPSLTPNSVAGPPAAASPLSATKSRSSWRYYPPTFCPTHPDSKPSRYSLRTCWPNLSEKQIEQLKKDRQALGPQSPSYSP